jgi:hypothetical protein
MGVMILTIYIDINHIYNDTIVYRPYFLGPKSRKKKTSGKLAPATG